MGNGQAALGVAVTVVVHEITDGPKESSVSVASECCEDISDSCLDLAGAVFQTGLEIGGVRLGGRRPDPDTRHSVTELTDKVQSFQNAGCTIRTGPVDGVLFLQDIQFAGVVCYHDAAGAWRRRSISLPESPAATTSWAGTP